jgi:hypothetical protein
MPARSSGWGQCYHHQIPPNRQDSPQQGGAAPAPLVLHPSKAATGSTEGSQTARACSEAAEMEVRLKQKVTQDVGKKKRNSSEKLLSCLLMLWLQLSVPQTIHSLHKQCTTRRSVKSQEICKVYTHVYRRLREDILYTISRRTQKKKPLSSFRNQQFRSGDVVSVEPMKIWFNPKDENKVIKEGKKTDG